MLGGHIFFFHSVQHPVETSVFVVLGYHFLLNFDEVVPKMKKDYHTI